MKVNNILFSSQCRIDNEDGPTAPTNTFIHLPSITKSESFTENSNIINVISVETSSSTKNLNSKLYNSLTEDKHCRFHYLHLYLNFSFFLLVVPFRPEFRNEHYKLTKHIVQQILCTVSWIFVMFRQFTMARATWDGQRTYRHLTLFYFFLSHSILHGVLLSIFYWTFFSKFEPLKDLLEKLSHSSLLIPSSKKQNKKWAGIIILHVYFLVMGLLSPLVGYNVIDSWCWTPSSLFQGYVPLARYAFFLSNITSADSKPDLDEISSFEIFLTILFIIMCGCYQLHLYFISLLFGLAILTLWEAANHFQNMIKSLNKNQTLCQDRKRTREIVLHLFYELKGISNILNDIWGNFCFCYVIDIVPYHATDLDSGLRARDWFDSLKMFRSLLYLGWNLFLSAETYRKAQWFHTWLLERHNRNLFLPYVEELKLLLHELGLEPIGMGTNGFYKINYAFVGQICATIITFFIITLQYADRGLTHECD